MASWPDSLMNSSVSSMCAARARLVQFNKKSNEPMGITLKVTEEYKCLVARVMQGGMIHRQGTLHAGDEIREINNKPVAGHTVEELQRILREARGNVNLVIIPSYRNNPVQCQIFVRALFDYDPRGDTLNPCPQASFPFNVGDILLIVSKDSHDWWQARLYETDSSLPAGLIPSPEILERCLANLSIESSVDEKLKCRWFGRRKRTTGDKSRLKHIAMFDQMELVTYEEVVLMKTYKRKTVVILGAHGVGRRYIKNMLIQCGPEKYAYPTPHTTKLMSKDEVDGQNYHFTTRDEMMKDIMNNEYLEYGTHEDEMYGIKLESIRHVHRKGLIAILDIEPQALKVLRSCEFAVYVVFIAAPPISLVTVTSTLSDNSLQRLTRESEYLQQNYRHYFDDIIVNHDIEDTISRLNQLIEERQSTPQWVPVNWVF